MKSGTQKKTHMTDYPGSPCRSCDGPDRGFIPPVPGLCEHHPAGVQQSPPRHFVVFHGEQPVRGGDRAYVISGFARAPGAHPRIHHGRAHAGETPAPSRGGDYPPHLPRRRPLRGAVRVRVICPAGAAAPLRTPAGTYTSIAAVEQYVMLPAIRSRRVINRLEIAIRRHPLRSSPHAAVSLRHAASFSTEKPARRNGHAADLSAACVRPPCTAPGRYRILEVFASSSRRSSPPSPASHIGRGAFSRPPPARRGATGSICRTCNTR